VKLLAYHIENNKLRTVRIASVEIESPTVRTFTFGDERCKTGEPGQFLMIWIPGVDEIPLSILDVKEGYSVSVAVKNVGQATDALHRKKINDIIDDYLKWAEKEITINKDDPGIGDVYIDISHLNLR